MAGSSTDARWCIGNVSVLDSTGAAGLSSVAVCVPEEEAASCTSSLDSLVSEEDEEETVTDLFPMDDFVSLERGVAGLSEVAVSVSDVSDVSDAGGAGCTFDFGAFDFGAAGLLELMVSSSNSLTSCTRLLFLASFFFLKMRKTATPTPASTKITTTTATTIPVSPSES